MEFYQFAKMGDRVSVVQRYASIVEKQSSKGPMLLVNVDSEYRNQLEELLVKVSMTTIWRQPT